MCRPTGPRIFAPHSKKTLSPVRYSMIVPIAVMQASPIANVTNAGTSAGRMIDVTRK